MSSGGLLKLILSLSFVAVFVVGAYIEWRYYVAHEIQSVAGSPNWPVDYASEGSLSATYCTVHRGGFQGGYTAMVYFHGYSMRIDSLVSDDSGRHIYYLVSKDGNIFFGWNQGDEYPTVYDYAKGESVDPDGNLQQVVLQADMSDITNSDVQCAPWWFPDDSYFDVPQLPTN